MNPFRYSINLRLAIANPNFLHSILIDLHNRRLRIKARSPFIDLLDFIVRIINDCFMFLNGFGCGIVEEDSFVVELLDEAPIVLLK